MLGAEFGARRMKIFASIVLWWVALPLWAGSLTAELDKNAGTIDDQYVLTLSVNGKADSKPRLPPIVGLEISSAGTSHSTSWVNGVVTREVRYRYVLMPTKEGTYKIPSLELEVDDELARSVPLTLTVGTANAPPPGGREQRALFITRTFALGGERESGKTAVQTPAPRVAYVGEQIVETIKIFYRVKLLDATQQEVELLAFDAFKLGKERNYRQVIEGTTYSVIEVKRVLVPLKAGEKLQVPRYILNTVIAADSQQRGRHSFFDDFFSSARQVRKRVSAPAATLTIKPLPAPPADALNLAVVGDYRLSAALNRQQLNRSESATLTLFIEGYGNLRGIKPLVLKFKGFKVYADKPTVKVREEREKGLYSQATLKLALQPLRHGNLDLGTLKFAWFDTPTGAFHQQTVDLGKLTVIASPQDEQQVVTAAQVGTARKSAVAVLGKDLITIHRGKALLVNHAFPLAERLRLLGTAAALLLVFSLLYLYVQYVRPRAASRRAQAWRTFKHAQQSLTEQGSAAQLAQNFRTFLAAKLGMQSMSATPHEIQRQLQEQQLEASLCQRVGRHLRELEKMLFAATKTGGVKFSDLLAETNNLAGELEKKC